MDPHKKKLVDWQIAEGDIAPQMDSSDQWFTTENFHWLPSKRQLRESGLQSVMEGWTPSAPIITPETRVIALGSCFASYFVIWLAEHGFNKLLPESPYNALIRNAFAFESVAVIAQQFRWAYEEFDPQNALWIEKSKERFEATEERRMLVRETLEKIDVLVLTLGLSEVWYDQVTNEPLWRTLPKKYYDPKRHNFKVETVSSTLACLEKIDALRAKYLPNLKIIFTISPVRLRATFRPVSALTANSVSKAILRASLDEFLRSRWDMVNKTYYYFPSYEMVLDVIKEPFKEDNRHLYDYVPAKILAAFSSYYTTDRDDGPEFASTTGREEDEVGAIVSHLEAKNAELQRVCDERLAVIEEIRTAAEERLSLINVLEEVAQERLQIIKRLESEMVARSGSEQSAE